MSVINPRIVAMGIRESGDTVMEVAALVDHLRQAAGTLDGKDAAADALKTAWEALTAAQVALDDAMQRLGAPL